MSYNTETKRYDSKQIDQSTSTNITNNSVNFILPENDFVWIGTESGLNCISNDKNIYTGLTNLDLKCAYINFRQLYLGTNDGLKVFSIDSKELVPTPQVLQTNKLNKINFIKNIDYDYLLFGTEDNGLFIYSIALKQLQQFNKYGKKAIDIFIDSEHFVWLKTEDYGIARINPETNRKKHYN